MLFHRPAATGQVVQDRRRRGGDQREAHEGQVPDRLGRARCTAYADVGAVSLDRPPPTCVSCGNGPDVDAARGCARRGLPDTPPRWLLPRSHQPGGRVLEVTTSSPTPGTSTGPVAAVLRRGAGTGADGGRGRRTTVRAIRLGFVRCAECVVSRRPDLRPVVAAVRAARGRVWRGRGQRGSAEFPDPRRPQHVRPAAPAGLGIRNHVRFADVVRAVWGRLPRRRALNRPGWHERCQVGPFRGDLLGRALGGHSKSWHRRRRARERPRRRRRLLHRKGSVAILARRACTSTEPTGPNQRARYAGIVKLPNGSRDGSAARGVSPMRRPRVSPPAGDVGHAVRQGLY